MANKEIGVFFPIFSLFSNDKIGCLGEEARELVSFLKECKVSIWQILPLNPTSFGNSPYQSPSNFGFNYYLIDLETLHEKNLLTKEELNAYKSNTSDIDESKVDYNFIYENKEKILRKAFSRFNKEESSFLSFKENNPRISDYAFFKVLKKLNNNTSWNFFEGGASSYNDNLKNEIITKYNDDYLFFVWTQYEFLNEYLSLKRFANENNIKIMGDLPIYVAYDSIDVFKDPFLFELNEHKEPINVAGCPPDFYSVDGQLWGNPLYDWDYCKKTNYAWWNVRISNALKIYDLVRIDHFRGFSAYYSIPYKDKTARNGKWVKGPGFDLFKDKLDLNIVAEDLGQLDDEFYEFKDKCGYPGMKIVTQAFDDEDIKNIWRPSNYTYNYFVYPSTHDSKTVKQYILDLNNEEKARFLRVLKDECKKLNVPYKDDLSIDELVYKVLEIGIASNAKAVILPIEDLLLLGKEGRINVPSTINDLNWTFRVKKEEFYAKRESMSNFILSMKEKYRP